MFPLGRFSFDKPNGGTKRFTWTNRRQIVFLLPFTLPSEGNSSITFGRAAFPYCYSSFSNGPCRTRAAKPRMIRLEPAKRALSSKISVNLIFLSKRPTTFTSSLHLAESPRTTLRMDVSRFAPGVAGSAAAPEFQILILIGCIPAIVHA